MFDLVPGPRQALDGRVKFRQVAAQYARAVARWVHGDEDGADGVRGAGLDDVNGGRQFVEFVGTYIGAVGEAEVDL